MVADAAQLEPRVLAALSGDRRLAEVSADADLCTSLAHTLFGRTPIEDDRARAKIAMLSAMYGGTSGEAAPLLLSTGPGALTALPVLRAAVAVLAEMATFADAGVSTADAPTGPADTPAGTADAPAIDMRK